MTTGETEAAPVDEVLVNSLVQRAVAAFNAHDADGFVALMTEDIVFEHSFAPATMHGRDEVSAFYTNTVWKAFPDLTLELMDGPFFHLHAQRISFKWLAAGTHTGPLDPPGLAPTSKRVEFDVREILEIRDGARGPDTSCGRHGRCHASTRYAPGTGWPGRASDRHDAAVADEAVTPIMTPDMRRTLCL